MLDLLLDTNVLIDYLDPNRPRHDEAESILLAATEGRCSCWIAPHSVNDAYYVLSKLLVRPSNGTYTDKDLRRDLEALCIVCSVTTVSRREVVDALRSDNPDFEDALVARCAETTAPCVLVTSDAGGFTSLPFGVQAAPLEWALHRVSL